MFVCSICGNPCEDCTDVLNHGVFWVPKVIEDMYRKYMDEVEENMEDEKNGRSSV